MTLINDSIGIVMPCHHSSSSCPIDLSHTCNWLEIIYIDIQDLGNILQEHHSYGHNHKLGVETCKNWVNKLTHECHMSHAVLRKKNILLWHP
jgi:hypothetical protein